MADLEALAARIEAAVVKLEALAAGGGGGGGDETEDYPPVLAYDSTFNPKLDSFTAAAQAIDAEIAEGSALVVALFREVRRLILGGARNAKPDDINVVLKPLLDAKNALDQWERKHFRSKWVQHLKTFHEVIAVFDWVTIGPSAGTYVTELTGAVQCYTNKILMEYRGKDNNQVNWVTGLIGALKALPEYISDFHKNGLSWNARAPKATGPAKFLNEGGAAPAAAAPAAAAPAPAPAPAPAAAPAAAKPALAIPVRAAPKKEPSAKQARLGLYTVEYFDGTDPVLPEEVSFKDIVNFFQCKNCTLKIPSKVKGLSFLQCEKVTLLVPDVIGVVEITSSKRVIVYVTGAVHSFTIDKCDNVQVNLNEASIDAQITVAQSQGLNVEVPDLAEEGNMIEFAVPEQIRVSLKDRKLVHEVYVHE
jgi:adenylyl cyclase-associated protein